MPVKVEIFKNNTLLKIDSIKFSLSHNDEDNSFSFSINNLTIEDAGSYSFLISNIFGKVTTSARLQINCKF